MPTTPGPSVAEEPRRRDPAEAIERAAMHLFAQQPFEDVPVHAIAEAAGVSVRTFYRYFPSKEEILIRLPMRRAQQIAGAALRRPSREAPFTAVRSAIHELAGSDDADLRRWQVAVARGHASERMAHVVVAMTGPVLTAAVTERGGLPDDDLWGEVAGVTIAAALVAGARRWARHGGSLRTELLAAVDIVGAGLRRRPRPSAGGAGRLRAGRA
jgi:TetR/AcrR family transcriptional regulator, regulator of mycofactocin system